MLFSTTTRPDIDDPAASVCDGNTTRADTRTRGRCGATEDGVRGFAVGGDAALAGCDDDWSPPPEQAASPRATATTTDFMPIGRSRAVFRFQLPRRPRATRSYCPLWRHIARARAAQNARRACLISRAPEHRRSPIPYRRLRERYPGPGACRQLTALDRHIGDALMSTWPALFGQRGVQSSWTIQREFDITRTRRRSLRTRVPPLVTPPGFHGAGGESHRRTHLTWATSGGRC